MATAPRYREIEVAGTPREMGRQIGEATGDAIRGFYETAIAHAGRTARLSRARMLEIATASIPYAADYSPEMVDELQGIAEASRLKLEDLMLLQIRNQLRPEGDAGCTSLSVTGEGSLRPGNVVAPELG